MGMAPCSLFSSHAIHVKFSTARDSQAVTHRGLLSNGGRNVVTIFRVSFNCFNIQCIVELKLAVFIYQCTLFCGHLCLSFPSGVVLESCASSILVGERGRRFKVHIPYIGGTSSLANPARQTKMSQHVGKWSESRKISSNTSFIVL